MLTSPSATPPTRKAGVPIAAGSPSGTDSGSPARSLMCCSKTAEWLISLPFAPVRRCALDRRWFRPLSVSGDGSGHPGCRACSTRCAVAANHPHGAVGSLPVAGRVVPLPVVAGVLQVLGVPCRREPFRAENGVRPPVDVVVAWSFEAGLKSGEPEIIERVAALDVAKAEVVCCARV